MEVILVIVLSILSLISLANLVILIYLAGFLVRLRGFVSEVLNLVVDVPIPETPQNTDVVVKPKTWDQKYEEELEMIERERRARQESGLVDLE